MIKPMKSPYNLPSVLRPLQQAAGWLLCCGVPLVVLPAAHAAADDITAVSAKVSDGYVRAKQPNGSFEPETYAFGEGGNWGGAMHDDTIDKLKFIDVARTIAGPLATQSYVPTSDPGTARLLIMVYWGTTAGTSADSGSAAYKNLQASQAPPPPPPPPPPSGAAARAAGTSSAGPAAVPDDTPDQLMKIVLMQGHQRDRTDRQNAAILGYDSEWEATQGPELGVIASRRKDLIDEIEDNRYFVVLMAYDFQLVRKEKKHKLLWETRFSIRERGNDFSKQLAGMAQNASKYFGQDSHGLMRKPLPEGHVTLGDLKVIEVVPDK